MSPAASSSPRSPRDRSPESETAVLGGLLAEPERFPELEPRLGPELFAEASNRVFYSILRAMQEDGKPIRDPAAVLVELRLRGKLDEIGGAVRVGALADSVPSADTISYHVNVLRECANRREVKRQADALALDVANGDWTADQIRARVDAIADFSARAAGDAAATPRFLRSLTEILSDATALDEPEPVIPRLAFLGRLTLLSAREKLGKSTLAAAGAAAVSRGRRFLNDETTRGTVLWVGLEEHVGDTARRFEEFAAAPDSIYVLDRLEGRDPFRDLGAAVRAKSARLVVVDTLSRFAESLVRDAGSSVEWIPVMAGFTRLARDSGAAVLLLHHARKDGGYRDSTAIGAGVDALFEMTRGDESVVRKVEGRGRWSMDDFALRLEENTISAPGAPARQYALSAGELSLDARILGYVESNPGVSLRKVRDNVTGGARAIGKAVEKLLERGLLANTGSVAMELRRGEPVPREEPLPDPIGSSGSPNRTAKEPRSRTAPSPDRFAVPAPRGGDPEPVLSAAFEEDSDAVA